MTATIAKQRLHAIIAEDRDRLRIPPGIDAALWARMDSKGRLRLRRNHSCSAADPFDRHRFAVACIQCGYAHRLGPCQTE